MPQALSGQLPPQALSSPNGAPPAQFPMPPGWTHEQWRVYGPEYIARMQAGQQSGGQQLAVAMAQVAVAQTQQLLPGITIVGGNDNKSPMVSMAAYEKMGKCCRGNTLIINPKNGQLVTIAEIVQRLKSDSRVLTMNAASLLTEVAPVKFFANEPKQLFRLRTQSGFEIEATAEHPFMTPNGWKALKDLDLKKDRVMTVAEYPQDIFWEGRERGAAALKVLAYLIADGDLVQMRFSKNEPAVRDDFVEAVEELGDRTTLSTKSDGKGVQVGIAGGKTRDLVKQAGLEDLRSADKHLPELLFSLKRANVALFLNRLFTCDGSVETSGRLSYSSTSLVLIQQVRHLLARFGIVATSRDKFDDEGKLYGRELVIGSRANIIRFIDEIGFFGEKGEKAEALREKLLLRTSRSQAGDETQLWRHGPYLFDRIASIEPTVVEPTFDIEIAGTHNFVANDFVVHNSTTAITTLRDWPEPGMDPLVLAFDPHGPDACVRLGYHPHAMRIRDLPGNSTFDKTKAALAMLHQNIDYVKRRYGAVVIDCASTMVMQFHDDAKNTPKNRNNPDTRAPYFELGLYVKEVIRKVMDLQLPNIWLAWLMEGSTSSEKDQSTGQQKKSTEMGGPDIMGRKVRNWIAGTSHHNFVLEKYRVAKGGVDPWGGKCDDEDFVRVIHTKPWGLINAGGRYSHLLPDPAPANLGWILSQITGRGPYAPGARR